jgi:hypothetical protein
VRLREGALTAGDLPGGFSAPQRTSTTVLRDSLTPGHELVGEVDFSVSGPDAQDVVAYLVFATPADATAFFAAPRVASEERNPLTFVPYGLDNPVQCRSAGVRGQAGNLLGMTACFVPRGTVVVVGISTLVDSSAALSHGNPDNAITLVAVGLRHYDAVLR